MNETFSLQDYEAAMSDKLAHEEGQAPWELAAIFVFLPLSFVAVCLRVWVRKGMINCFGKDDVMMLLAFLAFCVYSAALLVVVYVYDNGQTLDWWTLQGAVYWTMVDEVFYLITMIFLKLSLGLFFLRIIPKKGLRRLIYATMTLACVVNGYHIFFVIFACGDPKHYLHNLFKGKCASNNVILGLAYEQAAVTTVTDWVFAILPITILWHAKMDIRTKFVAGLILSLGALGSVASMVRFKYINGLAIRQDFFKDAASISIWSTIELGTGIVAGSMATLRPLFKKLFYKAKNITMTIRGFQSSAGAKKSKSNVTSRGRAKETSERPPMPRGKGSVDSSSSRASIAPATNDRIFDASHHSVHLTSIHGTHEVGDVYDDTHNITFEEVYDEEKGLGLTLREEKRVHLIHVRDDASVKSGEPAMWSQSPREAIKWPFSEGSPEHGISKVIDVEVSTSRVEEVGDAGTDEELGRTPDGSPSTLNIGRFSGVRLPERTARASMHSRKASLQRNPSQTSRKPSPSRGMSWFKSTPSTATPPNQTPSTVAMGTPQFTPLQHTVSAPAKWSPPKPNASYFTSSRGSPMKAKASIDDIMMSQDSQPKSPISMTASRGRKGSEDHGLICLTGPGTSAKLEDWDQLPDLILQKSPSRSQSPAKGPERPWGMFRTKSKQ